MKKINLKPNQVIVPGELYLGSEPILKIYYSIFEKGLGENLPPVLVIDSLLDVNYFPPVSRYNRIRNNESRTSFSSEEHKVACRKYELDCYVSEMREFLPFFIRLSKLRKSGSNYFLLDGNHRTTVAALTDSPIPALEISSDKDLEKVRNMIKEGELYDFPRPEKSMENLIVSLCEHCKSRLDLVDTVENRVKKLVFEENLPEYMVGKYLNA